MTSKVKISVKGNVLFQLAADGLLRKYLESFLEVHLDGLVQAEGDSIVFPGIPRSISESFCWDDSLYPAADWRGCDERSESLPQELQDQEWSCSLITPDVNGKEFEVKIKREGSLHRFLLPMGIQECIGEEGKAGEYSGIMEFPHPILRVTILDWLPLEEYSPRVKIVVRRDALIEEADPPAEDDIEWI